MAKIPNLKIKNLDFILKLNRNYNFSDNLQNNIILFLGIGVYFCAITDGIVTETNKFVVVK